MTSNCLPLSIGPMQQEDAEPFEDRSRAPYPFIRVDQEIRPRRQGYWPKLNVCDRSKGNVPGTHCTSKPVLTHEDWQTKDSIYPRRRRTQQECQNGAACCIMGLSI